MTVSLNTLQHRIRWSWASVAFAIWRAIPMSADHKTLYGRFSLWWLGQGGLVVGFKDFATYAASDLMVREFPR